MQHFPNTFDREAFFSGAEHCRDYCFSEYPVGNRELGSERSVSRGGGFRNWQGPDKAVTFPSGVTFRNSAGAFRYK